KLLLLLLLLLLAFLAAPAACVRGGSADVSEDEVLLETDFSEIGSWPEKIDVASGTAVQLTDDGYELSSTS
ncbi:MAG TPA: hypothetical protein PLW86_19715, partial [Rhodocyclaceae bacterium]|nr:hypothetical protein [Rhodocyclaceae bacterium]